MPHIWKKKKKKEDTPKEEKDLTEGRTTECEDKGGEVEEEEDIYGGLKLDFGPPPKPEDCVKDDAVSICVFEYSDIDGNYAPTKCYLCHLIEWIVKEIKSP